MSNETLPKVVLNPIVKGDIWSGHLEVESVALGPPEVVTDVNVTGNNWSIILVNQDEVTVLTMTNANGMLVLQNVNEIAWSVTETDTAQLIEGDKLYGELKNTTTMKTLMCFDVQVAGSNSN